MACTSRELCLSAPPLLDRAARSAAPHPLAPATPPRRQWARAAEHAVLFGEQPENPHCPPLLHTLTAPRYAVARVLVVPGHAAAQAAAVVGPSLALVALPCHRPCKLRSLALVEPPRPPAPATLVCACSSAAVFCRLRFALARCHMLACTASTCRLPHLPAPPHVFCLFVPSPAWHAFYCCPASCEADNAGEQRKYRSEEETRREKRKIM